MTNPSQQPEALDFAAIKASVSIATVLSHFGIALRGRGAERMARCPFHEDDKPSLQVNVEKGLFTCFACDAKGSVLDFVAKKEGCDLREAARRIVAIEGGGRKAETPADAEASTGASAPPGWREETQGQRRGEDTPARNRPLSFRLALDPKHPYLTGRGLSAETVRHFDLGLCEVGVMRGRVGIPIHDDGGKLVAYAGRWAGDDADLPEGEGKYKFPRGFRKSLVLYNLHRVPPTAGRVILVEGFFGVFALHQAGYENVVALMGSTISREQRALLVSRFREVIVLLDGDVAGRAATEAVRRCLAGHVATRVAWCRLGAQPDTLLADELRSVLS